MRSIKNNSVRKFFAFGIIGTMVFSMLSLFGNFGNSALAASFTKPYLIGPGDAPRSHSRHFHAPGNVKVKAKITYKREGNTDFPIVAEIESPTGQILESKNLTASSVQQTATLEAGPIGQHACGDLAWKVRVKSQNNAEPLSNVSGNITFSFVDPTAVSLDVEGQTINLNAGNSVTKKINGMTEKGPGKVKITATWFTLLPIKLKFQLIRPDGSVAATDTGYPQDAIFVNESEKIKLTYVVTAQDAQLSGSWKLKITNNTSDNASSINPKVSFTSGCF